MSIGSVQSNQWPTPRANSISSQSRPKAPWSAAPSLAPGATGSMQGSFGPAAPAGTGSGQAGTSATTAAKSPNPLQSIAPATQAMLIQAQSTSAPGAGSGAATLTPDQKLAADLNTLLSDLQSATTPTAQAPATQTASTDPTSAPGQANRHHHHHHDADDNASGASAVASASSTTAPTGSSQPMSQLFAAGIAQVLKAYSGGSASTTTPGLTM